MQRELQLDSSLFYCVKIIFRSIFIWYNSLVKYHILSRQKEQFYRKLELL